MDKPAREVHYDRKVWVNIKSETTRKKECLCLNCGDIEHCLKAKLFFRLCKRFGTAFMMTRCPDWFEMTEDQKSSLN